MSRAVTRWTYLGLAVLLIGLLVAGTGAATHLEERQCGSVGLVRVVPINSVNGSLDAYERVAFQNLTANEQRVFRSVREAGGQALTGRDAIRDAVVTYEGMQYLVVTAEQEGDCTPWDRSRVLAPLVSGLGLACLGGALIRGRDHH